MKTLLKYLFKTVISYLIFYGGGFFLLKIIARKKPLLVILNYHNFSRYNNYRIKRGSILETAFGENFRRQVRFLKKHFRFCYPEEFFSASVKNGLYVLFTFDDGYRDNFNIALPTLKEHNAKAVFFVSPKQLLEEGYFIHDKLRYLIEIGQLTEEYEETLRQLNQGKRYYLTTEVELVDSLFSKYNPQKRILMNVEELQEIAESGFKIGNHTYDHSALIFLSREEQLNSIKSCNTALQNLVVDKISHLAYPNGLYNDDTIALSSIAGIKYGYTIKGGFNDKSTSTYELGRIGINTSDSLPEIGLKLLVNLTFKRNRI